MHLHLPRQLLRFAPIRNLPSMYLVHHTSSHAYVNVSLAEDGLVLAGDVLRYDPWW